LCSKGSKLILIEIPATKTISWWRPKKIRQKPEHWCRQESQRFGRATRKNERLICTLNFVHTDLYIEIVPLPKFLGSGFHSVCLNIHQISIETFLA